jgi:inorganic pyrophosphatase
MVVLLDAPTFPGCLVTVRLLGVIDGEQSNDGRTYRNDRLIGAPDRSSTTRERTTLEEFEFDEIERFFVTYNQAQGRAFRVLGRHGPERAEQRIRESTHRSSRHAAGAGAGHRH